MSTATATPNRAATINRKTKRVVIKKERYTGPGLSCLGRAALKYFMENSYDFLVLRAQGIFSPADHDYLLSILEQPSTWAKDDRGHYDLDALQQLKEKTRGRDQEKTFDMLDRLARIGAILEASATTVKKALELDVSGNIPYTDSDIIEKSLIELYNDLGLTRAGYHYANAVMNHISTYDPDYKPE